MLSLRSSPTEAGRCARGVAVRVGGREGCPSAIRTASLFHPAGTAITPLVPGADHAALPTLHRTRFVAALAGGATAARERLLGLEVASATEGVLADPSDLLAHVAASDLIDEDGNPDPEGIREAADSVLERKPHLAPRTPTGDVGQGPRGKPAEVFDLVALLRERAG